MKGDLIDIQTHGKLSFMHRRVFKHCASLRSTATTLLDSFVVDDDKNAEKNALLR
ncbi:hypothetical protein BN439_2693 [Erwinia amylovora Ea644]|uniref:Uncharacterized protein n=2 Tax=Erwinia amylovora TaxID=552 RepID=A0A831A3B2_ERWAM|nr:hypothetical protein EaACW_2338 [Erwinia amylovora ACW56400]QJQ53973.1 hypothetical protein EHX00_1268 [Erwinia amylovora]CBA21500.1 hypothetical protein predicted by Glimmer/Critica [Erwinia amylovora CFBP1430]CCO79181.1 hypothetical protein BN432_2393 [Erwinia amylovora Ea356]CCO82987.1 hypothetical protein BN433_2426 [Erwinia amylovora Ea266]CCO86755.1 hypothetical protein BN434_2376 [Erwinia amylovora CFBP 2585]CCO90545.1 hypothetical protein BN435_2385 [Erwinia amylovora 01SFR-BO]CCO